VLVGVGALLGGLAACGEPPTTTAVTLTFSPDSSGPADLITTDAVVGVASLSLPAPDRPVPAPPPLVPLPVVRR
jgi:hypothetical protein